MSYFRGKSHFSEDGTQNYLVFQPIHRYFKLIDSTKYITEWKSKGLSDESIKSPSTSDNSLSSLIDYLGNKIRLKFNESCLKQQNKLTYTHGTIVNIFIVYEHVASGFFNDDPTLKKSLFDTVRLTRNADFDKYQYSDYGVGFERKGSFWFSCIGFGQNIIIFRVEMSPSVHVDNKRKYILILGFGPPM